MASSGLSGALSERAIRDLASQVPAGCVFTKGRVRQFSPSFGSMFGGPGGLMLALPQAATSAAEPIFHSGEARFETARGRRDGNLTIELVDLPWEFASALVTIGRLSSTQKSQLVGFLSSTGVLGRPVKASVIELAQEWLDIMGPLTAQDYFTGEEAGSQYAPSTPELRPADPCQAASEVDSLKARIAELESMQSIQALPQGQLLASPGQALLLRQVDLQREAAEEEQDAVDPVDLEALLGDLRSSPKKC